MSSYCKMFSKLNKKLNLKLNLSLYTKVLKTLNLIAAKLNGFTVNFVLLKILCANV